MDDVESTYAEVSKGIRCVCYMLVLAQFSPVLKQGTCLDWEGGGRKTLQQRHCRTCLWAISCLARSPLALRRSSPRVAQTRRIFERREDRWSTRCHRPMESAGVFKGPEVDAVGQRRATTTTWFPSGDAAGHLPDRRESDMCRWEWETTTLHLPLPLHGDQPPLSRIEGLCQGATGQGSRTKWEMHVRAAEGARWTSCRSSRRNITRPASPDAHDELGEFCHLYHIPSWQLL
ncbi:hypothetical protein QBC39DRAFT_66089 [Podospora conica]|nr:hypothetical protein QBC39DRAFT_66089 [Schizothecium conicum]